MANTTSLDIIAATAAPWLTEIPKLNLANIPFATTSTPSTSSPTTSAFTSALSHSNLPPLPSTPTRVQNTQGDCLPQPATYGPTPFPDTPTSFHTSLLLHAPALSAQIPSGYSLAFQARNASYVGTTYLGHYELEDYNTAECARKCNAWGVSGGRGESSIGSPATIPALDQLDSKIALPPPPQLCNGFNIYFERSPAIHLGPQCKHAASRTIIKCALWGEGMEEKGATNTGYMEWDFEVVIAGSNGYRLGKEEEDAKKSAGTKNVALGGWEILMSIAIMVGWLVVGSMDL